MSFAIIGALGAAIFDVSWSERAFVPTDFFGYFTVQSNTAVATLLAVSGATLLRGRDLSRVLQWLRPLVVVDMVVVGVIYATLLAPWGQPGGPFIPIANMVLHLISPIFVLVDWLLAPDRNRLGFGGVWAVLLHPIIYCAFTLGRAAFGDGWVPYPFLDPRLGYDVVLGYVAALTGCFVLVGAAVVLSTRWRPAWITDAVGAAVVRPERRPVAVRARPAPVALRAPVGGALPVHATMER